MNNDKDFDTHLDLKHKIKTISKQEVK